MEESKGQEHETAYRHLIRCGFDFDRQCELRQIVIVPSGAAVSWPALRRALHPGTKRSGYPFMQSAIPLFESPVPYFMLVQFTLDLWVHHVSFYVLRARADEHDLFRSWTGGFADFNKLREWKQDPTTRPADVRVVELDAEAGATT